MQMFLFTVVLSTPGGADAMNNNWDAVARTAFSIDKPSYSEASKLWATRKLREHYFGSQLVGMDTLLNLANLYSDAGFIYGAKKTALLHAKYAPVYTTMLGFKGIWSVSFEYGFTEIISKHSNKHFMWIGHTRQLCFNCFQSSKIHMFYFTFRHDSRRYYISCCSD